MAKKANPLKKSLANQIEKAREDYYNQTPTVDDLVYDDWLEQYKKIVLADGDDPNTDPILNPDVVGAPATTGNKVQHRTFMGSLDNSMTAEEFRAFDRRCGGGPYFCNPKYDGASIALYYQDGVLQQAVTRGNGIVGDDITANASKFMNLPKKAKNFTGAVRGEAILFNKEWLKIDPNMESNPRNLGSGIIQRSDGKNCELIRFMAFDINHEDGTVIPTEQEKEKAIEDFGFEVYAGFLCKTAEAVISEHDAIACTRKNMDFWIDGFVVKVNDVARQKELGISGKRPRGQTAYKFEAERAVTTLKEVIWTVGHTGAQIPTANLEPVRLGGTTVENALLCNMDEIARLEIAVGDKVEVYKAGEIIPKIFQVVERPKNRVIIEEPKTCVVCGGKTRRRKSSVKGKDQEGAVTECSNPDCDAKLYGKLKTFIKKVDILGVGDAVLKALVDAEYVVTIPDLYRLRDMDRGELASLQCGTMLGEKRVASIIEEIEKKRKLTIDLFLGSLGLPHLGRRRVQLIREAVPLFNDLAPWLEGKLIENADQAGVPGIAEAIQVGIDRSRNMIEDLLTQVKIVKPEPKKAATGGKLSGQSFVLTGTMSRSRKEIEADIEAAGGTIGSDVSKGLGFLVQADPSSQSSKSKKAAKLGIPVISEEQLMEML